MKFEAGSFPLSNFFLIDQSLKRPGGHHFDYARCVAQAANELGFLTTIGTHYRFSDSSPRDQPSLSNYGTVKRIFRETIYQPVSYLAGLQHLTRSNSGRFVDDPGNSSFVSKWLGRTFKFRHLRKRQRLIRGFAEDCRNFFRNSLQVAGDHVFLTTVSEIELLGLTRFLASNSKTRQTHWHLQFHYNLLDGRTPEYDSQQSLLRQVRQCFITALTDAPHHHLHFYSTSDTLVDQYNRLNVVQFEPLPYPIGQDFSPKKSVANVLCFNSQVEYSNESPPSAKSSLTVDSDVSCETQLSVFDSNGASTSTSEESFSSPLKITSPGELRREKGQHDYLQTLVDDIWPTHLATGKASLLLQRPKSKSLGRKKLAIDLPSRPDRNLPAPVQYFEHPLGHQDYVDLIRSTDIGLLFYDSRIYFSRRAGVLGELLSCGKPVIVSAGNWLADQIQAPTFEYIDGLLKSRYPTRSITLNELAWNHSNVPMPGGVLSFDQRRHPFEFSTDRQSGENGMIMEFDWHWPREAGTYCRITLTQKSPDGDVLQSRSQVVGHRRSNRKVNLFWTIDTEAKALDFSISNEYHDATASIRNLELHGFNFPENDVPRGSVGMIAADKDDLANCIDEMVRHIDHYRTSAQNFSSDWYSRHDATRTVEFLLAANQGTGSLRHVA